MHVRAKHSCADRARQAKAVELRARHEAIIVVKRRLCGRAVAVSCNTRCDAAQFMRTWPASCISSVRFSRNAHHLRPRDVSNCSITNGNNDTARAHSPGSRAERGHEERRKPLRLRGHQHEAWSKRPQVSVTALHALHAHWRAPLPGQMQTSFMSASGSMEVNAVPLLASLVSGRHVSTQEAAVSFVRMFAPDLCDARVARDHSPLAAGAGVPLDVHHRDAIHVVLRVQQNHALGTSRDMVTSARKPRTFVSTGRLERRS